MSHRTFKRGVSRSGACGLKLAASLTALFAASPALAGGALPTGGQLVAGQANIGATAAGHMVIDQASSHAIINWQNFSIGAGNNVQFNNGSGATLNRVTGGNLSQIDGVLKATGSAYLINPQGIVVGPGGKVITGGSFVASTRDIANDAFMRGEALRATGTSQGSVVNQGKIVSRYGDTILIGKSVSNSGSIKAPNGTAVLAAGDAVTLRPMDGDARISVSAGKGDVTNTGSIAAAQAELIAAGGNVYAVAGNQGGITVTGVKTVGGRIWLTGGQTAQISGAVTATNADGSGGTIIATAPDVRVDSGAQISASGTTGGTVLIGGDQAGGRDPARKLVTTEAATARTTKVAEGAKISADGSAGNGGAVVVWSDQDTSFAGSIFARGGGAGNGGFVETSGGHLSVAESAYVNTLAPLGAAGNWLLDPKNLIIQAGGNATAILSDPYNNNPSGTDTIDPSAITGAASGVTLQANNDITINSAVTMSNSVLLTLNAGRSILVNANVTSKGGFTATVNDSGADATNRDAGKAAFTMAAGTTISTISASANGGAISITTGTLAADNTGATSLVANIGDITLAAINTSGFGGASFAAAAGNLTVTNGQGNILSAASGGITLTANAAVATSGTAAGKNGGTIQLTATNGSIGSAAVRLGSISTNGGNGLGTNQAGGGGGAVTLIAGTDMWTSAVSSALGARTGSGTVGTNGTQILQATNGSITMKADALTAGGLVFTANATTGTVTILPVTNSVTMTIGGSGTGVGTVNLTTAAVAVMTANTLAFGSSANTNYVTIGVLPETTPVPTSNLAIPTTLKNVVVTSGLVDTGWGSVGINMGSGTLSGAANIVLNATGTGGYVYLQSGTVTAPTLTANATTEVGGAASFAYNNASGIVTLTSTGTTQYGSIGLDGAITANTLRLSGPGEIYQQTGAFKVTNLLVTGGTYIDLSGGNNGNQIATIAANTTGRIKLHDNLNLSIGSVLDANGVSVVGVTADKFNVSFASNNKTMTQSAPITANELSVVSGGTGTFVVTATLTNASNSIGTFAAAVTSTGTVNLSGINGLVIGALRDNQDVNLIASGITAGTVTLSNTGTVTQSSRITATNLLLRGSGAYTLTNTSNSIQTFAANTTGRTNLYNNRALVIGAVTDVSGTVNGVTANALNLQLGNFTVTQTQPISVNSLTLRNSSANIAVTYTLTNASNSVANFAAAVGTAGTVSLTNTSAMAIGAVLYDGVNLLNGVTAGTLTLTSTGAVTQDTAAANRISATNVALLGTGGSYGLGNTSNAIGTLAANTGSVNVANGASLSIGTVGSTIGITTTGAAAVSVTGNLTIAPAAKVTAGLNSNVALAATGNFINSRGSDAIAVSGTGRWLVYSSAPGSDTFGNLDSGNSAIWNATYASVPSGSVTQTGNRYLFASQPTLTFTTTSATKTYGDTPDLSAAFSASGFQAGVTNAYLADTAVNVYSGAPLVASAGAAASASVAGGPYAITAAQGTLTALNGYSFAFQNTGTLTVNPLGLTVTANSGQSKIYGAADPASFAYTITTGHLVGSDTLTGALSRVPGENAASYAIIQGTLAASSNYTLSYSGANFVIDPKALTVTANSGQSKFYGAADPTLTYANSGLVNGDDTTVFTGALSRAAGENKGVYAIGQGNLSAGDNYTIAFTGADFTINPASLTVTADTLNKIYGALDPALTYANSGLVNGDDTTVFTGALSRAAGENKGVYAIGQGNLSAGDNYTIAFTGADFTINPASLTVTADALSKIYGATDPTLTYANSGLVNGDTAAIFTGSLGRAAGENKGIYAIGQGSLSAGNNYTIAFTGADFTINAASLTVAAGSFSKTYGATDPALTYQITTGALAGSDTLSGALARGQGEGVGSYQVGQGTLSAGSNYVLTFVPGSLTITPASLTISAGNSSKIYGDAAVLAGFTASGLVRGDSVSSVALASSGAAVTAGVGSYAVSASNAAGSGLANYTITYNPGTLAVTARPLTITIASASRLYGAANPLFAAGSSGLVNGDSLSGAAASVATSASHVGSYLITPGTLTVSANYAPAFVTGTLTITPAALTVTANDSTASALSAARPTASFTGLVNSDTGAVVLGLQFGLFPVTSATYNIVPFGGSAQDYSIAYLPGLLTLSAQPSSPQQPSVISLAIPPQTGISSFTLTTGGQTLAFTNVATSAISDGPGAVTLFQIGVPGQLSGFISFAISDYSNATSDSDRLAAE